MAGELHEISHTLGEIEGRLASLVAQFQESERESRDNRASMHGRMDGQDRTLAAIVRDAEDTRFSVKKLEATITTDIKPVTDDVRRWRAMGMGALGVTGIGAASITGLVLWLLQHTFPNIKFP